MQLKHNYVNLQLPREIYTSTYACENINFQKGHKVIKTFVHVAYSACRELITF